MSEWVSTTLGAHASILAGYPFKSAGFLRAASNKTVRLCRGDNVKRGFLQWGDKARYWHQDESLSVFALTKGDVVLSMDGYVGKNWATVTDADLPAYLVQRVARLRGHASLDQRYLRYIISSPTFASYVDAIKTGTTIAHISARQIQDFPLQLPPIAEQVAIAGLLGLLDDKIELNRKLSATLDAIAKALFRSWFVDFEPVLAKTRKLATGLAPRIGELFPDSFQRSKMGQIPFGWSVSNLSGVLNFAYGKALKAENRAAGSVAVFGSNGQVGVHCEALVQGPGIIVGRKGNPGTVSWSQGDFWPIDTAFYVTTDLDASYLYYFYHALQLIDLPHLSADSAVPGLNRTHAGYSILLIPPENIVKAFADAAAPLQQRSAAAAIQSEALVSLRDMLLPRLISGVVRPAAALRAVERIA